MMYAYEDLSPEQFERLIVLLCQQLLGISVQGFATGTDGGRDAKFVGKAELLPSKAEPWVGITIIQAKHTNGLNRSFSDSDFFNPTSENNVIGKETPRITKLRAAKQLDNYMLFSNRRLTGNAETDVREHISSVCKIAASSLYMCGIEQLELWLKTFSAVPKLANLDRVDSPLMVSSAELAEVVEAFARHKNMVVAVIDDPPTARTSYEHKNVLNNMTLEYAAEQRRRYLKETVQIQSFLSAPENIELLRYYESVVDEFQLKIISKRQDYQTFDAVMEYLIDLLYARDPILRRRDNKRITRAMLFYMYWNCDIGRVGDAAAE